MLRHIFLWKLTEGADPQYVADRLNELPVNVPGCLSWTLGRHEGEEGINGGVWEYGLVADYPSAAELEEYTSHPFHVEVVEELLPFFAERAVCDFTIPEETSR